MPQMIIQNNFVDPVYMSFKTINFNFTCYWGENHETPKHDILSLENEGFIGHDVSKHKNM